MSGLSAIVGAWVVVYLVTIDTFQALALVNTNGVAIVASALSFSGAIIVALIQSRTKSGETAKFILDELRKSEAEALAQARLLAVAQAEAARLLVELASKRSGVRATDSDIAETKAASDVATAHVASLTAEQATEEASIRATEAKEFPPNEQP